MYKNIFVRFLVQVKTLEFGFEIQWKFATNGQFSKYFRESLYQYTFSLNMLPPDGISFWLYSKIYVCYSLDFGLYQFLSNIEPKNLYGKNCFSISTIQRNLPSTGNYTLHIYKQQCSTFLYVPGLKCFEILGLLHLNFLPHMQSLCTILERVPTKRVLNS